MSRSRPTSIQLRFSLEEYLKDQKQVTTDKFSWSSLVPLQYKHWEKLNSDKTIKRSFHSAVEYGGRIWVFGGEIEDQKKTNLVHAYDTRSNQWEQIQASGTPPSKRDGHSAVVYNHAMIIFGGSEEIPPVKKHFSVVSDGDDLYREQCTPTMYAFHFRDHTWEMMKTEKKGEPISRREHSANMYLDNMIVFGGLVGEQLNDTNELYQFNFSTNSWLKLGVDEKGEIPEPRRAHTAVVHNDSLFIFGGSGQNFKLFRDVYEFNFKNRLWTKIKTTGEVQYDRIYHTAVSIGDSMVIFGGMYAQSDVYKFNYVTRQWTKIFDAASLEKEAQEQKVQIKTEYPPVGRYGHCAIAIGTSMYVISGTDMTRKIYDDVYRFNFMTHLHVERWKKEIPLAAQRRESLKITSQIQFKGFTQEEKK